MYVRVEVHTRQKTGRDKQKAKQTREHMRKMEKKEIETVTEMIKKKRQRMLGERE